MQQNPNQNSEPPDADNISQTEEEPSAAPPAPPAGPDSNNASVPLKPGLAHRLFKNKRNLGLLILLVIIVAAACAYWFGFRHTSNNSANQQKPLANTQKQATSANESMPAAVPLDGSTYLDAAKPLPNLNLFTSTAFFGDYCTTDGCSSQTTVTPSDIDYYQIGTTKDGQQIIVFKTPLISMDSNVYYALGSAGKYKILTQMNSAHLDNSQHLASNVSLDPKTVLQAISFPDQVTVNGQKLKRGYDNNSFTSATFMDKGLQSIRGEDLGGPAKSYSKIGETGGFSYYEALLDDKGSFKVVEIYAVYKNLLSFPYTPNGEIASSNDKLAIKWSSGDNNLSEYYSAGKSCGTAEGYLVAENISGSDLIAVGKTPQGQTVYQLPTNNALAQKIYTEDYSGGEYLDNKALKNLTIQQITDKHAYFLAQNGLGEYVLFESRDLLPELGGCAKPVIYLYPRQTTTVNVKVGAQITKSDPFYTKQGWQQVVAHPDGQLDYRGSVYPYLFWEGYGDGKYPDINQGTIVKASDAAGVIRKQLAQQGLKPKEVNDFIAYWQPRLATVRQPYIRLTWLNTAAMNQLAPLSVSPAPRTVIRVFLDFQGLDKPFPLAGQKLTALHRTGFTLVEWGGFERPALD